MKPKTFTYNEIIKFFSDHRMPLKDEQIKLIASKVRVEHGLLEEYRKKQKEKRDKKILKIIERREAKKSKSDPGPEKKF